MTKEPPPAFTRAASGIQRVAVGTWRLHRQGEPRSPEKVAALLRAAVDLGITWLDTAEIYGGYETESLIGEAWRGDDALRSAFQVVTKCGIYVPSAAFPKVRTPHYVATAEQIIASAEKSLRLLGVDVIDVLLIHRPDWFASVEDTAEGLRTLLDQGKIRHAGVSNYSVPQFRALEAWLGKGSLVTNQIEFSLVKDAPIFDGTLDFCQERSLIPMAWSALGGGRILDPEKRSAELGATLARFAGDHGVSEDAVAMAWVMNHPARPVLITGTTRADRLRAASDAAGLRLEAEEWYALWAAAAGRNVP